MLLQAQSLIGIAALVIAAWGLSENRRVRPSWRWIASALAIQIMLAWAILNIPLIWDALELANRAVAAVESATRVGSSYIFGFLGGGPPPFKLEDGSQPQIIIAFQILPLVIVLSALSAVLWHWNILRTIVRGLSWLLRKSLGVSGVVGLSAGANIFLGVVESPLVLKAYLDRVSRGELFAIMCVTMSTISGAILILYASTLSAVVPNAVGQLISASLISLPAALLIARLMVPWDDRRTTADTSTELTYDSTMDAVVRGTMDGVQLFLAVIGIIIVVFALVALTDQALGLVPDVANGPLSLKRIFGWLFAPVMWALGIPWAEAGPAGALMGTKVIFNEYVAYLELAALPAGSLTPRSLLIVIYAMCGVANLASIGLLVSTIGTLAPNRRAETAALGFKSWIAGNAATAMTGAMIGLISPD